MKRNSEQARFPSYNVPRNIQCFLECSRICSMFPEMFPKMIMLIDPRIGQLTDHPMGRNIVTLVQMRRASHPQSLVPIRRVLQI